MNDDQPPGAGSEAAAGKAGSTPRPPAERDTAGRDGSPDRGGRPADGSKNAGEEFGSGFGGYQSGNQADARGGDAGGLPDLAIPMPACRPIANREPNRPTGPEPKGGATVQGGTEGR